MSCPQCPHCQSEVQKGGLSLISDRSSTEERREDQKEPPKYPVRGKAREYSKAFEIAWKAYPVRVQKFEAFAVWNVRAREIGENELLTLIMVALNWQKKGWAKEADWYKPPYFERYLKRRKWEDEPPGSQAVPRPIDRGTEATDRKVAQYREAQARAASPEEIRRAKEESGRIIRDLAEKKAVG